MDISNLDDITKYVKDLSGSHKYLDSAATGNKQEEESAVTEETPDLNSIYFKLHTYLGAAG